MICFQEGPYSCFFLHRDTSCYFSLPQRCHTLPSVWPELPAYYYPSLFPPPVPPARKTSWMLLLNQHAPHQHTKSKNKTIPLCLQNWTLSIWKYNCLVSRRGRAAVYQRDMLSLRKTWKWFSLTTKDVSNWTPGGNLDSVLSNAIILNNSLLLIVYDHEKYTQSPFLSV